MVNQEKIRLMTRLSILEKQHGKEIRKAENSFRIDLLTNPVWKMGFFASLLFAAAAGILAVCNLNMILDAFATGKLRGLIMAVLIAYGSILLITVIAASVWSYGSYRRALSYREQYRALLERVRRMDSGRKESASRYARGDAPGTAGTGPRRGEDDWEEDGGKSGRGKRKDLDYRRMQTLEFEDDEFCYYVEATPKRGGRRG